MTSLADFHKRLAAHDWHFQRTDDALVWERGNTEDRALKAIADESPAHRDLYNAWCKYEFGAGDKPVVPAELVS